MANNHGLGSITQIEVDKSKCRCRKWRIEVSLGKDPITGKRLRKSCVFHGTYAEAQKFLPLFSNEVKAGR